MKHICWVLFLCFFCSCKESENDRVVRLIKEWSGKEILFPTKAAFTSLGKDTGSLLNTGYDYVIVS